MKESATRHIDIRISEEERSTWVDLARLRNLSITDLVKRSVRIYLSLGEGEDNHETILVVDDESIQSCQSQIHRIGINHNQIAKSFNSLSKNLMSVVENSNSSSLDKDAIFSQLNSISETWSEIQKSLDSINDSLVALKENNPVNVSAPTIAKIEDGEL